MLASVGLEDRASEFSGNSKSKTDSHSAKKRNEEYYYRFLQVLFFLLIRICLKQRCEKFSGQISENCDIKCARDMDL
jgi:hypothetical protein